MFKIIKNEFNHPVVMAKETEKECLKWIWNELKSWEYADYYYPTIEKFEIWYNKIPDYNKSYLIEEF